MRARVRPTKTWISKSKVEIENEEELLACRRIILRIVRYMKDNKIKGNILNIASSSSLRPATSAYTISKWGIRGLTLGLAKSLAPLGIVVNGVAPGPTATPLRLDQLMKS